MNVYLRQVRDWRHADLRLRPTVLVIGLALVSPAEVRAQNQAPQQAALAAIKIPDEARDALAAITETADRICYIVKAEGTATSAKASGEIKTQLDGLLTKVINVDGKLAAGADSSHYQGVLQPDLPKAISDSAACKLQVFLKLSDQMVPQSKTKPEPPPSGSQAAAVQEAKVSLPVVVAVNPTTGSTPPPLNVQQDWRNVGNGVIVESSQGRWTTGTREQCAARYYSWNSDGNRISFRDQADQIDVEQVFAKLPDGFLTATVSSFHGPGSRTEPIGTKWQYQFITNDSIRVQNFKTGNSFNLTRC